MRAVADERLPEPYRSWITEARLPPDVVFLPSAGASGRTGMFMGPEGVLVRMEPDRCHPIPPDRFRGALMFQPPGTMDPTKRILFIETGDCRIEMPAAALSAHADRINEAARSLWPEWAGVGAFIREDRERLSDPRSVRARRWLAVTVGATIVASVANGFLDPGNRSGTLVAITALVYMLMMVLYIVRSAAFRRGSRCARCGGETIPVREALPYHHWYCPRCNVEWDDEAQKAAKSGATWQV